jgi:hypothetical protein
MSINQYDDDYSDDDEASENSGQGNIRDLRRAANKSKKLENELSSLKRELAFARAGLPLDDPKMNYFIKGYDGEMTAESIRQAALEAGFIAAQAQAQEQAQDAGLQAAASAQQRVIAASAGAVVEDSSEASALAHLEQAMAEGGVEALMDVARQYGIPTAYDS